MLCYGDCYTKHFLERDSLWEELSKVINTELKEQLLKHRAINNSYHVIWNHLDVNFESIIFHKFYRASSKGAWITFYFTLREIKKDYDTHRV